MKETSTAPARTPGLLHNPDFLKLWIGQTISELGSRITREGLPLVAVITLGATPMQMGFLNAAAGAPVLLISLFAGVWVDRLPRRPLMIVADLGRALLLATIPLAAITGWLSTQQLLVVIALTGMLTVLFHIAYRAYLPVLVTREHLVEGNSRLALSDAAAEVGGPGLAGLLVQTITAPIAILFDALSFLFSVASVALIRKPEQPPAPAENRQPMLLEAREGLRAVFGQPVLRALAAATATSSFFGNFIGVLYALYAIRTLKLSPAALGLSIAMGGIGNLLGALFAERITRRFGLGFTMIGMVFLESAFALLIPGAASLPRLALPMLMLSQLADMLGTIYFINAISVRQAITPDTLLGRVNASMELLTEGVGPLGALVGGLLGEIVGVQATLLVAVLGGALAGLWLLLSPIRRMHVLDYAPEAFE